MLIDWTDEFEGMRSNLTSRAATDPDARAVLTLVEFELDLLRRLDRPPTEDLPSLRQVRQSRRYPVWRLSHPYRKDRAVRTVVWFADDEHVVVVLFADDKARMGDVFYDSVGSRADQAIEGYLRRRGGEAR